MRAPVGHEADHRPQPPGVPSVADRPLDLVAGLVSGLMRHRSWDDPTSRLVHEVPGRRRTSNRAVGDPRAARRRRRRGSRQLLGGESLGARPFGRQEPVEF